MKKTKKTLSPQRAHAKALYVTMKTYMKVGFTRKEAFLMVTQGVAGRKNPKKASAKNPRKAGKRR